MSLSSNVDTQFSNAGAPNLLPFSAFLAFYLAFRGQEERDIMFGGRKFMDSAGYLHSY